MGAKSLAVQSIAFAVAGLTLVSAPVHAADCGGSVIDARFASAAAYCDKVVPRAVAPVETATAVFPSTVSVSMPGYRKRLSQAVRRVETSGGAAPTAPLINAIAARYRIEPHLLAAIVRTESRGHLQAVSSKGALGLMQVMPDTARSVGVSDPRMMLTNPVLALSTGAVYLKRLQAQFGNNVPLVLAAYNAGPGAVRHAGGRVPNYRETRGYVAAITSGYAAGTVRR